MSQIQLVSQIHNLHTQEKRFPKEPERITVRLGLT